MGIYYRKSVKIGRFLRLNFSTHGVGASVGMRGLRVGRNAHGQAYIAGGRRGVYFRKLLSQRKAG